MDQPIITTAVSRELERLFLLHAKGVLRERDISNHLANFLTQENAAGLLAALPDDAVPLLKSAIVTAVQEMINPVWLVPEEPIFHENTVTAAYNLQVASLLLQPSATLSSPTITVVCLPSFGLEWSLQIRESANDDCPAILAEPEEKIWCHPNWRTIPVKIWQRSLDMSLVHSAAEVWRQILLRTRPSSRSSSGIDGVDYHFGYSGAGAGRLAGMIWSPRSTTIPGKLVDISHSLREFVLGDNTQIERIHRDLEICLIEIARVNGTDSI